MDMPLLDVRDQWAESLSREFADLAAEHDRTGTFPRETIPRLHAAGLLGLTVPREFGGAGAGLARAAEVVGQIAQGEPATALVLAMQSSITRCWRATTTGRPKSTRSWRGKRCRTAR